MNIENRIKDDQENLMTPLAARLWNGSVGYAWADVDILETPNEYVFSFDIPVTLRDNIRIRVEDNQIRVSAKQANAGRYANIVDSNKEFTEYKRNFRLPLPVDGSNVNARFIDGVLIIVLPKSLEAKLNYLNLN